MLAVNKTHLLCSSVNIMIDWLCSVLCPLQHSIGYVGDGFYRSKDPTNSIKVKKNLQRKKHKQRRKHNTHRNAK